MPVLWSTFYRGGGTVSNRTKVRAHSTARSATKIKAQAAVIRRQGGIILTQRKLLLRWIALFGDYCTTAESGQLYKDTKEVV